MLGRLIRIALAALVIFASWRVGQAYLAHYRFSDEVSRIAQRGVHTDEAEVRAAVDEAADRLGIPVDPGKVAVRLAGEHVYVDLRYTRTIEVLPRYTYPWEFSVSAHGWVVPMGGFKKQ